MNVRCKNKTVGKDVDALLNQIEEQKLQRIICQSLSDSYCDLEVI